MTIRYNKYSDTITTILPKDRIFLRDSDVDITNVRTIRQRVYALEKALGLVDLFSIYN